MITAYAADNATVLSTIVTADMCKTVLNEVTGLIPVVLADFQELKSYRNDRIWGVNDRL